MARQLSATAPVSTTVQLSRRVAHVRRKPWLESLARLRRDRAAMLGFVIVVFIAALAILAPFISPHDYTAISFAKKLAPPGDGYFFGGDELGRDLLARTLWGARASLPISLIAVTASTLLGTVIGIMAGYYGRGFDMLSMRFMDILLAFPQLVLPLALLAVLGPDIRNLVIALVISSVPGHARLARGMAVSIKSMQYVESAHAVGARNARIMFRYILPNSAAPILISASASLGGLILAEAGLSFLGLGIQPPTPSWGMMLSQGRQYLENSPWVSFWPGLAIFLTVIGFNLLGDGIRDAIDPRLHRS